VQYALSDINLDGGNVIRWNTKAILTDRIFDENEHMDPFKLLNELEHILQAEVIIIPQYPGELTGHADGLIRFINRDTVLINDTTNEISSWKYSLLKVLKDRHLQPVEICTCCSTSITSDSAIGLYINYLQLQQVIMVPIFGNKRDEKTLRIIQDVFHNTPVEPIAINAIGKQGGLMNCITWNILV
jgi:agmatine deiminase